MPKTVSELKTWRVATIVMTMLAIAVFCVQRFVTQIFDIAFEIYIFHVPAVTIFICVFYLYREKRRL